MYLFSSLNLKEVSRVTWIVIFLVVFLFSPSKGLPYLPEHSITQEQLSAHFVFDFDLQVKLSHILLRTKPIFFQKIIGNSMEGQHFKIRLIKYYLF